MIAYRSTTVSALGGVAMDADGLRRRAADLMEHAKGERDPVNHMALIELVIAFLVRARELDQGKKSD